MKTRSSHVVLVLGSLALLGAAGIPALAAMPQGETEPATQAPVAVNEGSRLQPGQGSVVESLLHVHDVLGQAVAAAPGVEIAGTRLPGSRAPLPLPPSVRSGEAFAHLGLRALRVESFQGDEVPAADGSEAHHAVGLTLGYKVAEEANALMAADVLGLVLASSHRLTVASQSTVDPKAGDDGWHQVVYALHYDSRLGKDLDQEHGQAAAPSPEDLPLRIRRCAQSKNVRLGPLSIVTNDGDGSVVHVIHRFDSGSERDRAAKLGNFFTLLSGSTPRMRATGFRSELEPDGVWAQTFTVRAD